MRLRNRSSGGVAMPVQIHQKTLGRRDVPHGIEIELEFRGADNVPIPALLQLPSRGETAPAALLLHGLTSRKEVLAHTVGTTLLLYGVATLAIDLPLHGRRDDPRAADSLRNPLKMVAHWRQALAEARLAVAYLVARPEVDSTRLGIVGYSLGAQIAVATAAKEKRIRTVVLAAGGDLPDGTPFTTMARALADPLKSVRAIAGRPLLMVHGRNDRTVRPDQAQRLFDAAGEPKEIRWLEAGHYLPTEAVDGAALWLKDRLGSTL
jgi:dienelactone hydrolase